jgi:hypothetical protein
MAAADALGEVRDRSDRRQHPTFDVGAHGREVADRERDEEPDETVVRREGEDEAARTPVELEAGAGHAAVVREVPACRRRRRFAHGRAHVPGEAGVAPVGTDDDGGALGRARSAAHVRPTMPVMRSPSQV